MNRAWLWFSLMGFGLFLVFTRPPAILGTLQGNADEDRVVISAPIQLMLTGGDRFLAANLEAIRSAAAGIDDSSAGMLYQLRSHQLVAQLNPCHEDNYYLGGTLLSWGGAVDAGNDLLYRAAECRRWDYLPAFLYGLNQLYFYHDNAKARRFLEIAAHRSPANYAGLMKTSIMIAASEIEDDRMALDYLKQQQEQASDPKLRIMLSKRVGRLEGLIVLRDAQKRFEKEYKRPLRTPNELITSKQLNSFPSDPLGLGYEFVNGMFVLHQLKMASMEAKQ